MKFILDKLMGYAEANMELSRYDAAKLRFMLELILLNTTMLTSFAVFFLFIGRAAEFFIVTGVLVSVRWFCGGFHFKKYRYCVALSFALFAAVILLLPDISGVYGVMEGLLAISILINMALAPVSKRNAAHSAKSNLMFKIISTIIFLGYTVFLLLARDNPYASMITWMLFIVAVQLIVGKVMILRGKGK